MKTKYPYINSIRMSNFWGLGDHDVYVEVTHSDDYKNEEHFSKLTFDEAVAKMKEYTDKYPVNMEADE